MGDQGGESGGGERERGGGGKERGDKGWGWKVVERDYQIPCISVIYSILFCKKGDDVLWKIWDSMISDPNETQKANQDENKPFPIVNWMKKLEDTKLKKEVDESIH